MPIDKEQSRHLLSEFDRLSGKVLRLTPRSVRETIQNILIRPALDEVRELIDRSRPPVLFVVGRKGAGKSTLIDTLSKRPGSREAEGRETQHYRLRYPHVDASWEVYESGGIPDADESPLTASEALEDEIVAARPDVILHVIPVDGARNRAADFALLQTVSETVSDRLERTVPVVNVLSQTELLNQTDDWPPRPRTHQAKAIVDEVDYLARQVLHTSRKPIDRDMPARGVSLEHAFHQSIIPVSADDASTWNVETLALCVGEQLPRSAQLDYYQALGLRQGMRNVSSDLIQRFSTLASGIGATPIPLADIFLITPLQLLMIALIGALSGRPPSLRTAFQYLTAAGVNVGVGMGMRTTARQVLKFVPIGGHVAAGAIAGTGTYALGKAAEAYFFGGQVNSLQKLVDRYKTRFGIPAQQRLEVVEQQVGQRFPRASAWVGRLLPGHTEEEQDRDRPTAERATVKAARRTQRPDTTEADVVADATATPRKAPPRKRPAKKTATAKAPAKKTAAPRARPAKKAAAKTSARKTDAAPKKPRKATTKKAAGTAASRKKTTKPPRDA